jgi:thiol-disulfide isomerase/thioredoxin
VSVVRLKLVVVVVVATAAVLVFRQPLRRALFERAALSNPAPSPEVISDLIEHAANPPAALLEAWNTGKIGDREVAIHEVSALFPTRQALPVPIASLVLSAALDPDLSVRETALGILRERRDPALAVVAVEQLRDADQQVRLLGLNCLKQAAPAVGVPRAAALLDDPNPAVRGVSVKLLERWSGESFGVKLADTVLVDNQTNGLLEFQAAGVTRIEAAAAKARSWWSAHQTAFPPVKLDVPPAAFAARQALLAPDFTLRTLEGREVRLADYRGRVVLINFWATWCSACVGEIPALVALQKQHRNNLVILGVSLDLVPAEDAAPAARNLTAAARQQIREKVARAVKARGINYPVLLDERDEAGGLYNGGELPTTVIVDARGNVRRRFIGPRSLAVFEAMIAEASANSTNATAIAAAGAESRQPATEHAGGKAGP